MAGTAEMLHALGCQLTEGCEYCALETPQRFTEMEVYQRNSHIVFPFTVL